jgi:hypothetical protein
MRLTVRTDFALCVLIQVGLNDGKLTTIKDIAQSFGISKPHLTKVVNDSVKRVISTQCGAVTALDRAIAFAFKAANDTKLILGVAHHLSDIDVSRFAHQTDAAASACSAGPCVVQPRHFGGSGCLCFG